jgi:hypothetical protein
MTDMISWREDRLRAIALNAIREARVAYQRDVGPWLDDDSKRMNLIFDLLHIVEIEQVDAQNEHFPVVAANQPEPNPALNAVAKALASLPEDFEASEEMKPTFKIPVKK